MIVPMEGMVPMKWGLEKVPIAVERVGGLNLVSRMLPQQQ